MCHVIIHVAPRMFQEYLEWREAAADVCFPAVHMDPLDHVHAYVRAVADATRELCDLIVSSYQETTSVISKSGGCSRYVT